MHQLDAQKEALNLIKNSPLVEVVTFGSHNFPDIRTMLKIDSEDFTIWMTTGKSSRKVAQLLHNPKAICYFVDPQTMTSLRIYGEITIIEDMDTKNRLWQSSWTQYFEGPEDPEYILLKLKPTKIRHTDKNQETVFDPPGIS